MKKSLTILIIVISILLLAFLGWYFLLRDKSIPAREAIFDILPFGSGEDMNVPALPPVDINGDGEDIEQLDEFGSPAANLFRISDIPVAGAVIFNRNNRPIVRYVDRATGHIYDVSLPTEENQDPLEKIKVTNNTLPKIYEAHFRSDGNAVLLRSLRDDSDVIENLSLALTPPQTNTLYMVSSTAIRGNISSVAVGSGNTLFYALKDSSSIVSSAFNGAGTRTLLNSPFTDWRLAAAGNRLIAYTKASVAASGFAYNINTSNGAFTKILGPLNGLVVIPNTAGNRILYSYIENGQTRLLANNSQGEIISEMTPATIAEKCVWSAKDINLVLCGSPANPIGPSEPDNWYRGVTHFSDRIWLFDTNIQTAQILVEPKPTLGIDIDVVELKLSPDEDYLIFINKTDLTLWALRLVDSN